jgi:hypothetical protein
VLAAEEILSILERGGQSELHGVRHPRTPALVRGRGADRARLPAMTPSVQSHSVSS